VHLDIESEVLALVLLFALKDKVFLLFVGRKSELMLEGLVIFCQMQHIFPTKFPATSHLKFLCRVEACFAI
jgi:hypothetical protein